MNPFKFNRNQENPFNIGDKFLFPVELTEITKDKHNKISYKLTTLCESPVTLYGVTLNDLERISKERMNE